MKFSLVNIKTSAAKAVNRGVLKLRKASPEIALAVGIVGIGATVVLACKETLKAEEIIDKHNDNLEKIEKASNYEGAKYTDVDRRNDLIITYASTAKRFVRLYAPAIITGVSSVTLILVSHGILRKRNMAVMAAYAALSTDFKNYRNRVREEMGENYDRHFLHGTKETIEKRVIDENGKAKKIEESIVTVENSPSIYSRFFDESNINWVPNPEMNLIFLKAQEQHFNDMLKVRGHVFLNEVYDALGLARSQVGAVTGWVDGNGDNYVDFGIYNKDSWATRQFVNGNEPVILLDFNVDGIIWDKI